MKMLLIPPNDAVAHIEQYKYTKLIYLSQTIMTQLTGLAYTTTGEIGFPHYHRGGLFQLFRMVPFGWEITGKIKSVCSTHNKRLYVGKENGKRFSFCKKCLNKIYV